MAVQACKRRLLSYIVIQTIKNLPGVRLVRTWRYRRLFLNATDKNLFMGVYPSLAAAAAAAPTSKPQGYDHSGAAAMYDERHGQLFDTDYPVLFWLQRFIHDVKTVFDFGGHRGIAYFTYKQHLSFEHLKAWIVYDVPAVVAAGKAMVEKKNLNQLRFSDDAHLAGAADLFFASGSLQYVDTPLEIAAGNGTPRHVVINMLPVGRDGEFFTVQNIGTAFCPYHIYDEQKVVQAFTKLGYRLVDRWQNPGKICHVPFEPKTAVDYVGFYFCRD